MRWYGRPPCGTSRPECVSGFENVAFVSPPPLPLPLLFSLAFPVPLQPSVFQQMKQGEEEAARLERERIRAQEAANRLEEARQEIDVRPLRRVPYNLPRCAQRTTSPCLYAFICCILLYS